MTDNIPAPEFSRIVKVSDITNSGKAEKIEAEPSELDALAKRFDLPEIQLLGANYVLSCEDSDVQCTGQFSAKISQRCAISGDTFQQSVTDDFKVIFTPDLATPDESETDIELASEDCDQMFYNNQQIDVGEAIAQTLYLSLDPYPRSPDADEVARKKGLKSEEEVGPFGALSALKDKMKQEKS